MHYFKVFSLVPRKTWYWRIPAFEPVTQWKGHLPVTLYLSAWSYKERLDRLEKQLCDVPLSAEHCVEMLFLFCEDFFSCQKALLFNPMWGPKMCFLKDAVFILENACFCCHCSILPIHMDEPPFIKVCSLTLHFHASITLLNCRNNTDFVYRWKLTALVKCAKSVCF